jgi:hypothetical protein
VYSVSSSWKLEGHAIPLRSSPRADSPLSRLMNLRPGSNRTAGQIGIDRDHGVDLGGRAFGRVEL